MITLISGIPGSGKSLNAVSRYLLPALKANRRVVTNISGLDLLLVSVYIDLDPQEVEKNLIIQDEFSTEIIQEVCKQNDLIIIDEAQLYWNSRDFKEQENKNVLAILQKHRHYGQDYVFLTQNIDQVDVGIRRLCAVHYRLVKLSNVGLPTKTQVKIYPDAMGSEAFAPTATQVWSIDKRIFSLYRSHVSDEVKETQVKISPFKNVKFILTTGVFVLCLIMVSKRFIFSDRPFFDPPDFGKMKNEKIVEDKTIFLEAFSYDGETVYILQLDSTVKTIKLKGFPKNQVVKGKAE